MPEYFSLENRAVYETMWKNMIRAHQATDDNKKHALCMLGSKGQRLHYNRLYSLLFHYNNGHAYAPQCTVLSFTFLGPKPFHFPSKF